MTQERIVWISIRKRTRRRRINSVILIELKPVMNLIFRLEDTMYNRFYLKIPAKQVIKLSGGRGSPDFDKIKGPSNNRNIVDK